MTVAEKYMSGVSETIFIVVKGLHMNIMVAAKHVKDRIKGNV